MSLDCGWLDYLLLSLPEETELTFDPLWSGGEDKLHCGIRWETLIWGEGKRIFPAIRINIFVPSLRNIPTVYKYT